MALKNALLAVAAIAPTVLAQGGAYAQCGGNGFTGAKTCVSGYTCTYSNDCSVTTTAVPTPTSSGNPGTTSPPTPTGGSTGNPFANVQQYANPYYSSEIHTHAIPSLTGAAAVKASAVAKVGTFVWLDTTAKVPAVETYLTNIEALNAAGASPPVIVSFVVYDLPNRDCAALASNGEYSIANGGVAKYKAYIDSIRAILLRHSQTKVVLVIEPDSLANMVTNMNVAKCANAAATYKSLTIYAMQQLNLPNVSMYLDAGLGWEANLGPAADLFSGVYISAGKPAAVRGLATNVSNYNAWRATTCAPYTTPNVNCDEKRYINAIGPLLASRGECDGTSDTSAVRYDAHCGLPSALKPAPEAGQWFQAYFEQLLTNANPSF